MATIITISTIDNDQVNVRNLFTHTAAEVAAGLQAHVEAQNKKREALMKMETICLAVTPAMAEIITAKGGAVYFNSRTPYIKVDVDKLAEICK
jgi:pyrroline-5-carboxylate reductase